MKYQDRLVKEFKFIYDDEVIDNVKAINDEEIIITTIYGSQYKVSYNGGNIETIYLN